jgi:hypothetical protein
LPSIVLGIVIGPHVFGFTTFPGEIWRTPRSWVEACYPNLISFNEVDKGGHFAALVRAGA